MTDETVQTATPTVAERLRAAAHTLATHLEADIKIVEFDAKEILERMEDLVGLGNAAASSTTATKDPAPAPVEDTSGTTDPAVQQ